MTSVYIIITNRFRNVKHFLKFQYQNFVHFAQYIIRGTHWHKRPSYQTNLDYLAGFSKQPYLYFPYSKYALRQSTFILPIQNYIFVTFVQFFRVLYCLFGNKAIYPTKDDDARRRKKTKPTICVSAKCRLFGCGKVWLYGYNATIFRETLRYMVHLCTIVSKHLR